jgi:hypothetical protein
MEQLAVWELIQKDAFEEACKVADLEYAQTKDIFPIRNKVYALFHLEKYEEAISTIQLVERSENTKADSDAIFLGIADWLLGRKPEAVEVWKKGRDSNYSDAAGGVELEIILVFSAIKLWLHKKSATFNQLWAGRLP